MARRVSFADWVMVNERRYRRPISAARRTQTNSLRYYWVMVNERRELAKAALALGARLR